MARATVRGHVARMSRKTFLTVVGVMGLVVGLVALVFPSVMLAG